MSASRFGWVRPTPGQRPRCGILLHAAYQVYWSWLEHHDQRASRLYIFIFEASTLLALKASLVNVIAAKSCTRNYVHVVVWPDSLAALNFSSGRVLHPNCHRLVSGVELLMLSGIVVVGSLLGWFCAMTEDNVVWTRLTAVLALLRACWSKARDPTPLQEN